MFHVYVLLTNGKKLFKKKSIIKIPPPPEFSIGADSLLRNLDDASQRSINGARVAEKLLHCVPSVDNFRLALRGIKLWAKSMFIQSFFCLHATGYKILIKETSYSSSAAYNSLSGFVWEQKKQKKKKIRSWSIR